MIPVMSFWPSIYEKIEKQYKLIEYRRRFPANCKFAYMYVSKPVKAICGIIYFGQKYDLKHWKNIYSSNLEINSRIDKFLEKYNYGIEITAFQKIKPITLYELRRNIKNFVAPQSYILLENNNELFEYLNKNVVFIGNRIENDLTGIFPEHICKEY